jgi:hypothetical protein
MKIILLTVIIAACAVHAGPVVNSCYTIQPELDRFFGGLNHICRVPSFINPAGVALIPKNQTTAGWCNWKFTRPTGTYWRLEQPTLPGYFMYLSLAPIPGYWGRQFWTSTSTSDLTTRFTIGTWQTSSNYTFSPDTNTSNVMVRDGIFTANPIHREMNLFDAVSKGFQQLFQHSLQLVTC